MIEDTQKIIDDYIFNSEYFSNEFESYLKSNNDLSNYLIKAVYKSLDQKNANALCFGLEAIFLHGNIDRKYSEIFSAVLSINESWNKNHECVCEMFEGIKDPTTVEILYKTAVSHPPSDTHSIPLKAMWALRVIGSPEAEESLKNLCNSTNEITAKIAKQELDSLHKLKAST